MGERRQARILALQALYYVDMDKGDPRELLDLFCEHLAGSVIETVNPLFFSAGERCYGIRASAGCPFEQICHQLAGGPNVRGGSKCPSHGHL